MSNGAQSIVLHRPWRGAPQSRTLRIKRFFGTSENAIKTQIWIAVSVSVLVAIVKKRRNLNASLYTLLQILSVTFFEKMPLHQAFPGRAKLP